MSILPKPNMSIIKPTILSDLVRIGNPNDGGYVINNRVLDVTKTLLGFGINDDWSFELDFYNQSNQPTIHMFDHTVGLRIFKRRYKYALADLFSLQSLIYIFSNRKTYFEDYSKKKATYLSFKKLLSNTKMNFHGLGISNYKEEAIITYNDVIKDYVNNAEKNSVFLKIDIENHEYRIFEDILSHLDIVNGMVVEFHELDLSYERFETIINKLKDTFEITHVHGNNYNRTIEGSQMPLTLEVTFLKKELIDFNIETINEGKQYPLQDLDAPNWAIKEDMQLKF